METIDSITRMLIAIIIAYLFFAKQITGTLEIMLAIFAVVFLVTSLSSFYPLYFPFGFKTLKNK